MTYVDPPVTPASICAAREASNAERQEVARLSGVPIPLHPEPEFEIHAAQDGLSNLIKKYGAARVMRWVKNLAHIAGQEVS